MATVDIDLGSYKLGWHDTEDDYVFKPKKGLNEEIIRQMSAMKRRARVDARLPPQGVQAVPEEAAARPGAVAAPSKTSTSTTSTTTSSRPKVRPRTGTWCPTPSRRPTRSWASPKPSASTWPESRPSTRARSCTTATARTSKSSACSSVTWTPPSASIPRSSRSTSARSSRPNDNKFAALNSAVWSGGSVHLRAPRSASSTSRSRPTSGSTPRTWASSSGR